MYLEKTADVLGSSGPLIFLGIFSGDDGDPKLAKGVNEYLS